MGGTTKSAPGSGFGEKTSSETFPQIDDSLGVFFFCILPVVDKIRLEKKKCPRGQCYPACCTYGYYLQSKKCFPTPIPSGLSPKRGVQLHSVVPLRKITRSQRKFPTTAVRNLPLKTGAVRLGGNDDEIDCCYH